MPVSVDCLHWSIPQPICLPGLFTGPHSGRDEPSRQESSLNRSSLPPSSPSSSSSSLQACAKLMRRFDQLAPPPSSTPSPYPSHCLPPMSALTHWHSWMVTSQSWPPLPLQTPVGRYIRSSFGLSCYWCDWLIKIVLVVFISFEKTIFILKIGSHVFFNHDLAWSNNFSLVSVNDAPVPSICSEWCQHRPFSASLVLDMTDPH